jgi:hypothetical protein
VGRAVGHAASRGASRGTCRRSGRHGVGRACLCRLGRGRGRRGAGRGGRGRRRRLFAVGCAGCLRRSRTRGLGGGRRVVCGEQEGTALVRRIGGVRVECDFFAVAWKVGRRIPIPMRSMLVVAEVGVLGCVSVS